MSCREPRKKLKFCKVFENLSKEKMAEFSKIFKIKLRYAKSVSRKKKLFDFFVFLYQPVRSLISFVGVSSSRALKEKQKLPSSSMLQTYKAYLPNYTN